MQHLDLQHPTFNMREHTNALFVGNKLTTMTTETRTITDNLDELLGVLPPDLQKAIAPDDRPNLIEIVLDLGRKPEARLPGRFVYLREEPVTRDELQWVEKRLGAFGNDNRAGIPATLHRISAMRNRRGEVVGLTMRVGRAVLGIVDILRDLIESGESILLMGRPGLGKTTMLREMARVLADEVGKRVVIVDTSNEIAGDGDVPHPAIGRARRMQVARVENQHDVMIEAVENHMPEVVVIDEIGRVEETLAARTIAERGVQLVATAHGNTLDNLLANPTMSDLIGGIQAVTLSDEEARRRGTQKTVLERKAPPTFDVVVEMIERDRISVRRPVDEVVDALLRGYEAPPETRWRDENGDVIVEQATAQNSSAGREHDFEMRGDAGRGGRNERRAPDRRGNSRNGQNRRNTERNGDRQGRRARLDFGDSKDLPLERTVRRYSLNSLRDDDSAMQTLVVSPSVSGEDVLSRESGTIEYSIPSLESPELPSRDDIEGYNGDIEGPRLRGDTPVDVSKVRRLYPFGVSRSRLGRAIKHLGLPLAVAKTWREADAAAVLVGPDGIALDGSLLREAREMGLPMIGISGNTYAEILDRLNTLYASQVGEGTASSRDLALHEAQDAVQRVLKEAEPIELRPQPKELRRAQHELAERFHLRSYSVGREPNRRVRLLPSLGYR
jgi:stage III sporulation protein SpoIIIAA